MEESIHELVRGEMRSVMADLIARPTNVRFQSDTQLQILRDRIVTLEDTLSKSEADRAAVYLKLDQMQKAFNTAQEEKTSLLHEMHHSKQASAGEWHSMVTAARDETDKLRRQLAHITEKYDADIRPLRDKIQEQDQEIKKLKKAVKAASTAANDALVTERDTKMNCVTLADLHYSNERLSAQLAKVQAPPQSPIFDEEKFKECERSIIALTNELSQLEQKMHQMHGEHEKEKVELQTALDRQYRDFSVERAECDRVVGIMAAKLESLISENNLLKVQQKQKTQRPTTPRRDRSRTE